MPLILQAASSLRAQGHGGRGPGRQVWKVCVQSAVYPKPLELTLHCKESHVTVVRGNAGQTPGGIRRVVKWLQKTPLNLSVLRRIGFIAPGNAQRTSCRPRR